MKKSVKIFAVLVLVVMILSIATNVLAAQLTPDDITPNYNGDTTALQNKAGQIMGMIRNVAVIAAVIIIMILGVKYMLGSVEEKAEYKKSFVPLIVGIILVVCATAIASFIFNMAG